MTMLSTPVGKVAFSQLEESRSFKDDPELPKKYSITVEFEGADAKALRSQLIDLGKSALHLKLIDGKMKVTFYRADKLDKPRLVDKTKEPIVERPRYLTKGTEVKVLYLPTETSVGLSLQLDAVMVVGEMEAMAPASKPIEVSDPIKAEFLDVF